LQELKKPRAFARGFFVEWAALKWTTIRQSTDLGGAREIEMANREQRNNREKKKPKQDKNKKKDGPQPVSAFAAQAPGMGKPQQQQPIKK